MRVGGRRVMENVLVAHSGILVWYLIFKSRSMLCKAVRN